MERAPYFIKQSRLAALVLGLALAGFAGEAPKTAAEAKTPAAGNAIHAEGGHDCAKHEGDCPKDAMGKKSKDGMCDKHGHAGKTGSEAKGAAHAHAAAAPAAATPEAKPAAAAKAPAKAP